MMPPPTQDPFELSRLLEDSKRTITRMQHDLDLVRENQRDTAILNGDLRDYNNQLRGEVADLRAQLTYATRTLTAQIQEQVDRARSTGSSEKKLRDVVDEQKRAIQKFVQEKKTNLQRIKTLENQIKGQAHNAKAEPKKTKAQKKREKREAEREKREIEREKRELGRLSALHPAQAQSQAAVSASAHTPISPAGANLPNTIKEEMMAIDDDTAADGIVPGLALLEDDSHSKEVIEQLKRHMAKRTGSKKLPSFLNSGTKNKCFCIHEVLAMGSSACKPLLPSKSYCMVLGPTCNFLVEVVETASGNRLRTFSPWGVYTPYH
ncbi:hypothetical protein FPOAC2_08776 [Fusarium poae]|uniref:hypothetical protein n=1 Tax=Fusarium poae TaxID=36050 RepID=UPI001CEB2A06|nr:hypothetical protein FPOAC1_008841 [Fusarium poae]KAG8669446.1 hypothetical protein FPOAC1_008841 [Fusarium poae]